MSALGARNAAALEAPACEDVVIVSDELTRFEADAYCRYAVRERQKVDAYWGPGWREPIWIHVASAYRISRALVPGHFGDRGRIEMPLRSVRAGTSALLHEIVHVYAPHANRFLAEGLAVYLHARLAGNRAFPNFGDDLRGLAVRHLSEVASLAELHAVRTPRPLSAVADQRTAYLLAGSFVGFLIERYGLAQFRALYETEDCAAVYGKSFAALEVEWRSSLGQ